MVLQKWVASAGVFEKEHYNSDMSQSGWLDIKDINNLKLHLCMWGSDSKLLGSHVRLTARLEHCVPIEILLSLGLIKHLLCNLYFALCLQLVFVVVHGNKKKVII